MGLVVLLIGILVAATLIGVYITQKHTEKMVMQVLNAKDGEKIQQIISVNEQENMAAIFVNSPNDSTTVLYDYRRNLIGIRTINSSFCCVLRMDRCKTPSIQDILREMDNIKTRKTSSEDQIMYSATAEEKADPMDLGTSMNILCSNVDIYWAKLESPKDVRRFRLRHIKWHIQANLGISIGN
ncbi:pulmonary surfactant-associated protein C-like [Hyla sarda]|uniref:pulmonary surfactant-associated protein C-like n=1 Tax=Hyla sarda TaxID=327740 RepID=UPI0024C38270|nr:pulmonary surfactant-associated protein C-like [Hyla sarda]